MDVVLKLRDLARSARAQSERCRAPLGRRREGDQFLRELFDSDAIKRRSRDEKLIAGIAQLPPRARNALSERFELMLESRAHGERSCIRD